MAELQVETKDNQIIMSREYDAPKALVFSMFSNPEHLAKWWGPTGWPATIKSFEFKPGGVWHYYMQGPDGTQSWGKSTFSEIDEPNMLSFTDAFSDEEGNVNTEMPQGKMTFTFEENDGKTIMRVIGEYQSAEQVAELVKMGMVEGITDTTHQLAALLAGAQK